MNILLFALKDGVPFAERAKEAGTVTLLGMVAIFVVLALLWGVIEILHRLLGGAGKKKAEQPAQSAPTGEIAPAAVPEESAEDDGALVAAVTAAISAAMAEDGYTGGFRVVSFKRAPARRNGRA